MIALRQLLVIEDEHDLALTSLAKQRSEAQHIDDPQFLALAFEVIDAEQCIV